MNRRYMNQRITGTGLLTVMAALLCTLGAGCTSAPEVPSGPITPEALVRRIEAGDAPLMVDVRQAAEFAQGHVPGAINIPHDVMGERLAELGPDRDREIVIYCRSGRRAVVAEEILAAAGFTHVRDLDGHMLDWKAAGRPTE